MISRSYRHNRYVCLSFPIALALVLILAACGESRGGEDGNTKGSADSSPTTPAVVGATPLATRFIPGTVALFDIPGKDASSLDLGTAVIRAAWIDNGETLVVFDAYTGAYQAMLLDGTVVRDIAHARYTTGYEPLPLVHVVPVHDGKSVAVSDWKARTVTIVDVTDGSETVLKANAVVQFSPRGAWLAGGTVSVDADRENEPDKTVIGVFARDGDCGDDTPYACLEWELPSDPDVRRSFAPEPWSPDGKHLLIQTTSVCCQEVVFEVYAWPSGRRVLTAPSIGEAWWAGPERLHVNGSPDAYFIDMDGTRSAVPDVLDDCCNSYSPDGTYAVDSVIPGEDCSLVDAATGETLATVQGGAGDTNDTGICQFVSWTADGTRAIATGVGVP